MVEVALELGPRRRVFAQALGWIGWCRAGRDEAMALAALAAAAPRYRALTAKAGLAPPTATIDDLRVVQRVVGNATTDFGAPAFPIEEDLGPLDAPGRERRTALLVACWSAFDAALAAAPTAARDLEPGSGRSPAALRLHVCEAEVMHLSAFGPAYRPPDPADLAAIEGATRGALLSALASLPLGRRFETRRRYGFDWTPLFAVRRAAWHALDHAWELRDRSI